MLHIEGGSIEIAIPLVNEKIRKHILGSHCPHYLHRTKCLNLRNLLPIESNRLLKIIIASLVNNKPYRLSLLILLTNSEITIETRIFKSRQPNIHIPSRAQQIDPTQHPNKFYLLSICTSINASAYPAGSESPTTTSLRYNSLTETVLT